MSINLRVKDEVDVVNDQELRKRIIDEIQGNENQARKDEAFRRHLCYKDRTKHFVVEELLKQFDDNTVREMSYSLSNLSIAKKIIDKLARVYSSGVNRNVEPPEAQDAVDNIIKITEMNRRMKQANRYLRAHRNTIVGVLPCAQYHNGIANYEIDIQPLQPHLYDVIEKYYDREDPMFVILSNYQPKAPMRSSLDPAKEGRGFMNIQQSSIGDGKDQGIADVPEDQGAGEDQYIWWSDHYHFTTNCKGEFIPQGNEKSRGVVTADDIVNPIQELPFVNFAIDQEGAFWSEGGDDIFDGAVKANCMITNIDHIGVTQGYGQFYMKGKGLPKFVKMGPNKAVLLEVESKDDPDPAIGFASSSPKLQELKDQVEMYISLLLTTNNLSTRAMSAELRGTKDMASGIALLIDRADSVEDVHDQRDIFIAKEPMIFDKIQKWQEVYKNILTDDWKKFILPRGIKVEPKFTDPRPILSETEKLQDIQLRQTLGINTRAEILMMDDQSLTEEQAEQRLQDILEDKVQAKIDAQKILGPNQAADGSQPPNGAQNQNQNADQMNGANGAQNANEGDQSGRQQRPNSQRN